ncbi:MAG: hypothetical protein QOJ29_2965 [Thermoleophilaceae bacterium]|jgi:hypothetical protein|nr:hypothetical protein [Thermoleophilaceae bacterium]
MPLAITSYQWFLSVHILCAVLWVGANFAFVILYTRMRPETDAAGTARLIRDNEFIGNKMFAPLSVILLVMGFILIGKGDWNYDFWIIFGFFVWAFSFLNGVGYLGRRALPLAARLESEGYTGTVVNDFRNWHRAAHIEFGLLVLVVLDMALKPGA